LRGGFESRELEMDLGADVAFDWKTKKSIKTMDRIQEDCDWWWHI
jgi:hypothetical protein